jgi:hypothetical protein
MELAASMQPKTVKLGDEMCQFATVFLKGTQERSNPMQRSLNKRLIFRVLENMPMSSYLACVLLTIFVNILVDSKFYSLTEGEMYE